MKKDSDIVPICIYDFGARKIDIRYNKNSKRYYMEYDNKRKEISEASYNELITYPNQTDINNVPRNNFIKYGMIVHESKPFPRNSGPLITSIQTTIGKATSDKTIKERLGELYDKLMPQAQLATPPSSTSTGQGLGEPTTVILPSSPTELKKELLLIIASLKAGNNSTDLKNKAAAIIDQLRKKKKIGVSKERELLSFLIA